MARSRNWKQGPKSKKFENAWSQCFGTEIPVGCKIGREESYIGAQYATDEADFSSMLHALESLGLEGGTTKRVTRAQRVATKFASHYGSNDSVIEKWQALCEDCGINIVPPSIKQCKKVELSHPTCPTEMMLTYVSAILGTEKREYQHIPFS